MYYCTLVPGLSCLGMSRDIPKYALIYSGLSCPGTSLDILRHPNCPLYVLIVFYFLRHPWISPRRPEACTNALWSLIFCVLGLPGTYRDIPRHPKLCTSALWSLVFHVLELPGMYRDIPMHPKLYITTLWSLVFHVLGLPGMYRNIPRHPKLCITALWSLVFHVLGLPGTCQDIPRHPKLLLSCPEMSQNILKPSNCSLCKVLDFNFLGYLATSTLSIIHIQYYYAVVPGLSCPRISKLSQVYVRTCTNPLWYLVFHA